MTEQTKLTPCPFCEGPPVPVCVDTITGKVFNAVPEEGMCVDAYVFCHECGAQGPSNVEYVHDMTETNDLTAKGIQGWNERHARNRDLYDACERDALNLWPRAES